MARNRIRKRIFDDKILLPLEIRKKIKIIFGRKTRHMIRRMADDNENYKLKKLKIYTEFDNDEKNCVYLIIIYTKAFVNFCRNFIIN
jgi:hypothetical protein